MLDETMRSPATPASVAPAPLQRPLVLDLDGTLLKTDLLWECLVAAIKRNPLVIVFVIPWLMLGRAALKRRLALFATLDIATLPVDQALVDFAMAQARNGRRIVLATAADETIAQRVAARYTFIDEVLASDGGSNLKHHAKAAMLLRLYPGGFDYAGDAAADLPVWRAAVGSLIVRASDSTLRAASAIREPLLVIPRRPVTLRIVMRAMRVRQWAKNALVLAPIPLAGRILDGGAWLDGLGALLALGLVASATYLVNDILDLNDDRRHWSKRNRPLASGDLPLATGLIMVPILAAAGFGLAVAVGRDVAGIIALYATITLAYSMRLKRVPILDVTLLAGLFTLRLFLGVVAIDAIISPWLFVFSMALFLSLSLAKRHTEVVRMVGHGLTAAAGRGYQARDEAFLLAMGMAAAASAIILLTLYLASEAFKAAYYTAPAFLWIAPAVLLLWLGRVWLLSQRGELDDDPVAFALGDGCSLALAGLLCLAFLGASVGGMLG